MSGIAPALRNLNAQIVQGGFDDIVPTYPSTLAKEARQATAARIANTFAEDLANSQLDGRTGIGIEIDVRA